MPSIARGEGDGLAEMNDPLPDIPTETLANWQRIVDLIARLADVPAGLVMRRHAPFHSVQVSSVGADNPYVPGQRFTLSERLYCHGVMQRDGELVVEDAQCTPEWADNDDLEHGMSFYIGYPLKWPDGQIFGTICVLDRRRNRRALMFREGLREFARVIEADLALLFEMCRRQRLEIELQAALDQMEQRVAERTHELEEANTALRVLLGNLERSRAEHDARIAQQIKGLVMPHLGKLRARAGGDEATALYLRLIEENLADLTGMAEGGLVELLDGLTPTEREVAQMVLRGLTTKEIARALARGTSTVDFHRNNIRRKLGLGGSGQGLRALLLARQK